MIESHVELRVGWRQPSGAGEDRNELRDGIDGTVVAGGASPPGLARIATHGVLVEVQATAEWRQPSGAGEDRNSWKR